MENFNLLMQGFGTALTLANLLSALIGAFLGTVVGVLPGIGPSTTVALLIPIAFTMRPETALIMMTAVYCGAMYGGSLTSILLKVPGEASSVMTSIDGYELAKQGRAGSALSISAIGSWVGGTLSVVGLMFLAPPLAEFALKFGPAEYFGVMVAALLLSVSLMSKDLVKGLVAIGLGLMLSLVGTDLQVGVPRFTLGITELLDGVELLTVLIGVFGVGEIFWYFREAREDKSMSERQSIVGGLWPNKEEARASVGPVARGSVVGFIAGVLPGSGSSLGSILAYVLEKRVSKRPEKFGNGAIEAVAAAETANNSATGGALIPMLTLGVPGSGTTAVMMGALMMYGIRPGPMLFTQQADLVWTIIASLYISNIILLILNLPFVGLFVKILDIPARYLIPMVLCLAVVGAYSANNSLIDIGLVILFGIVGYFMRLGGFPPAALVLALVLGDRLEQSFRQALQLSGGDATVFVTKPIAAITLAAGLAAVAWDLYRSYKKRNQARRAAA
ncbi:MAG: tripartite tricarboxylate transporter permease [Bacillota bacterium]